MTVLKLLTRTTSWPRFVASITRPPSGRSPGSRARDAAPEVEGQREERERAAVYMDGLSQMRSRLGRQGKERRATARRNGRRLGS
jgi:hypothetical protein